MTDRNQTNPQGWPMLLAPAVGACWAAATLFNPGLFNDADTNWHLATGQWILAHGQVPTTDPFSWSAAGRAWVAHEWLSEVVMALVYRTGGWAGLAVLTAAILATLLTLIAIRAGQALPPERAMVAVIIVAAALAPSTLVRPHLAGYLLLASWTLLLIAARRRDTPPPWWSLLILVLWANAHASYVVGIGVAGVFGLEALLHSRDRWQACWRWALFGLGCIAAALLTPLGPRALLYPFDVSAMQSLSYISEWRPLDPHRDVLAMAVMAIVMAALLHLRRNVGLVRAGLLIGLMVMAVLHVRHQAVFVIVSSLVLLEAARSALGQGVSAPAGGPRRAVLAALALMLAASIARLAVPLVRSDSTSYPLAAIAAVPAAIRAQPVINFYDFGGALILAGIRPYVDGRADMYGDAHMLRYARVMAGDAAEFHAVVRVGGVGWLMVPPDSALRALAEREGWQRLHADRGAVVLIRPASLSAPVS